MKIDQVIDSGVYICETNSMNLFICRPKYCIIRRIQFYH